jgi:hypothetical protein
MIGVQETLAGDPFSGGDHGRMGARVRRWAAIRIATALGVGVACVVVNACGGAGSSVTPKPAESATASATARPTVTPAGLGLYPAVSTPVVAAPSAMAFAWLQLAISKTIPGSDIFAKAPPMPTVINRTNGAVSLAEAHSIEVAIWREEALLQWAEAHDEVGFTINTLLGSQESNFFLPDVQSALGQGGTVLDPNCDVFPVSVTLWPHTAGVDAWLTDANEQTSAPDVAVLPFNEANCRLTITVHGKVSTESADPIDPHGVDRVLFVGEVVNDSTVGTFFKVEASTSCLRPQAVAAMCG